MAKGKRKKAAAAERKGKRQRLEQQPAPPAPPQQQSPPPNPAAVGDQAPGPPSHHVQVLTADERLEALLGILNRPVDEVLTTVVFAGTKAGCDKLHAALAAQPGSARWALEVVHGNKRRDEQEASLRAFAAGQCRCLVCERARIYTRVHACAWGHCRRLGTFARGWAAWRPCLGVVSYMDGGAADRICAANSFLAGTC